MEGQTAVQTDGWKDDWIDECIHGWMDEWKYGWIDGSTECMPGWTEGIL